jgi:hypothetical protein
MKNEDARVRELLRQGFKVDLLNPGAKTFNEKYRAYRLGGAGKKYAVLDEEGNIVGVQG